MARMISWQSSGSVRTERPAKYATPCLVRMTFVSVEKCSATSWRWTSISAGGIVPSGSSMMLYACAMISAGVIAYSFLCGA
ncbi:hypothetical protein D3C78_1534320 [compost metagenome]